ncbi:flagellar brake protein [Candidatus Poribacteria bacterium]|nr:flagellar brake protein [Candidatus Poribacteria bacterium]
MNQPILKPGIKVQVETLSGAPRCRFLSRITHIDDYYIYIAKPSIYDFEDGGQTGIPPNTLLRVSFSLSEGEFAFDSTVKGRQADGSYVLTRPRRFYRWKRQFLRVETSLWVRYAVIPRVEMAGRVDQVKRAYAMTANISGGGVLLKPQETLPVGAILEMEIELPGRSDPILAIGRVVHTKSGNGVEFLIINELDRNELIKYLFEEDRRRRRRLREKGYGGDLPTGIYPHSSGDR